MRTRLLSLEEIQNQLSLKLAKVPQGIRDEFSNLSLNSSNLSSSDICQIENFLETTLPSIFTATILKYDFGDSSIGNVWFGRLAKYSSWLMSRNSLELPFCWWGEGNRPTNIIKIAETDGYILLLETQSEEILSFRRSGEWKNSEVVAKDFELFVRLAGTAYLNYDIPATEVELLEFKSVLGIGNIELPIFWADLLSGIT